MTCQRNLLSDINSGPRLFRNPTVDFRNPSIVFRFPSQRSRCISQILYLKWYIFRPSYPSWFTRPNNTRQILLIFSSTCYLSRDDHYDRKIRARRQRADIGKYCILKRTIKLWKKPPAEALGTGSCKARVFRKWVREVIISEEKWRVLWSVVKKRPKVQGREKWGVKWSEVKWRFRWNVCIIFYLQLCNCMYVLCSTLCHYYLLLFVILFTVM